MTHPLTHIKIVLAELLRQLEPQGASAVVVTLVRANGDLASHGACLTGTEAPMQRVEEIILAEFPPRDIASKGAF